MARFISCEDYDWDFDPVETNDEWVHVDNLPDFDAVKEKLAQLLKIAEACGSNPEMLQCIEDVCGLLETR